MAAIVNLDHQPTYLHWHFLMLSVPNLVVLAVMLIVFALAIALPFPGARAARTVSGAGGDSR